MVDIQSVLATISRYRIAALVIVIEISLAFAIFSNAIFLISERITRITMPSGVAESQLVRLQVTANISSDPSSVQALTLTDLATLSALPGVTSATVTNQIPFSGSEWSTGVMLTPDQKEPTLSSSLYMGDQSFLETMGLRLTAGRPFEDDEVQWMGPGLKVQSAILSRSAAARLFPGKSGLGETIYLGDTQPVKVVGIVDHLIRPHFGFADTDTLAYSVIVPVRMSYAAGAVYVLRTVSGEQASVLLNARRQLLAKNPGLAIVDGSPLEAMRMKFFRQERSMAWLLSGVCIALLLVTALGIFGLTSFWTEQRTSQIGVRRALGATKGQILAQFLSENALLVFGGILLGIPLAIAANGYMVDVHGIPSLPLGYLPLGVASLLALGQLSVWIPARRAASISPAEATRKN